MIFDIIDPGLNPVPMWWAVGISIFALVLFILSIIGAVRDYDPDYAGMGFMVGALIAGFAWLILLGTVATPEYNSAIHDLKVAGIESLGFTDVTLTGDTFTASQDGEFFSGLIVEIEPDRFKVLDLDN